MATVLYSPGSALLTVTLTAAEQVSAGRVLAKGASALEENITDFLRIRYRAIVEHDTTMITTRLETATESERSEIKSTLKLVDDAAVKP